MILKQLNMLTKSGGPDAMGTVNDGTLWVVRLQLLLVVSPHFCFLFALDWSEFGQLQAWSVESACSSSEGILWTKSLLAG